MQKKGLIGLVLLSIAASLLLAACGGGGSSSTSSSTAATNTGNEPASAEPSSATTSGEIVPAPAETPPTQLPALPPLPKPPPKGLNIVNLQCDYTACTPFATTIKQSAKALGWHLKDIVFKTGQPQAALTNAINSPGVEYITLSGVPQDIVEPQIKEATEKGIKLISCCDVAEPAPPTWPVQISNEEGNVIKPSEEMAKWMINDSEGHANVVNVGLPEIPITKPNGPTVQRVLEENCPGCTFAEIATTGEEDAAGTVPAKVVAYLQGHPEVNYVQVAFGDLLTGIPQALKAAGLAEKVKVVGMDSLLGPEGQALKNEEVAAWYVAGQGDFGNYMADAIAREAEGLPLPQKIYKEQPQTWLCTPQKADECTNWWGPKGFQQQFEKLWGLK